MSRVRTVIAVIAMVTIVGAGGAWAVGRSGATAASGTVTVDVDHPLARFRPDTALGAGLDGQDAGSVGPMYAPANVAAMQTVGLHSITYRLRTELADEAWHWNPAGAWSDPAHQQGYWTSSTTASAPIETSYGYKLPRRGNTHDQADDNGYSRIDDGDPATYWKSDPYLDPHFTGEPTAAHPQWVLVDMGGPVPVDAVRMAWAQPFAVDYQVQYWTGADDPFSITDAASGQWRTFANGTVDNSDGGIDARRIAPSPLRVEFVRLLLTKSSEQALAESTDVRDGLGFALRELAIGTESASGAFRDLVRHGTTASTQSTVYVSSTDPWHRASDLDRNTEQPGFDRVLSSGLLDGSPATVPVPLLFGTPEDAVAELEFLQARHFPVGRVELGEEPDGQNVLPEDYGALYVQWAAALHAVAPDLLLGGPSLQTGFEEVRVWADASGETSWLRRLVRYLAARHASADLSFLSVEWYPFDDACSAPAPNLAAEPGLLATAFKTWAADGLGSVPKLVTEYGYSAQAARPEVGLEGALLDDDFAAQFLELGGTAAYLYGYEPNILLKEPDCNSWGNIMLLQSDDSFHIVDRVAAYYGTRLLTQSWLQPGNSLNTIYAATLSIGGRHVAASAYAVRRPDGTWSLLLLDKDPHRPLDVTVRFVAGGRGRGGLRGTVRLAQFGPAQYQWHAHGEDGRPSRSQPPVVNLSRDGGPVSLPPYSLSVLTGEGPSPGA